MLEMDLAAKLLPVRILHPSVYHFLVRHAVHMLQHLQTHHQASGFAGAPLIRAIQGSEAFIEHRPVDHLGQAVEFVIAVDDVVQLQSEQIELGLIRRFFRDHFSLRNCKELTINYNITCNIRTVIMEYYININSMLCTIY